MSKREKFNPDELPTYGYMRFASVPSPVVDDVELSAEDVRVLVTLGTYASKQNDMWCWPKLDTIAERLGVERQAISRSVGRLEARGYIEVRAGFDSKGFQVQNWYRLILDYTLPPERMRSNHATRRRAGIGGKPTHKGSQGGTPSTGPGGTPSTGPGGTPSTGPGGTPSTPQESENMNLRNETEKWKRAGVSPSLGDEMSSEARTAEPERTLPTPPAPSPCPVVAVSIDDVTQGWQRDDKLVTVIKRDLHHRGITQGRYDRIFAFARLYSSMRYRHVWLLTFDNAEHAKQAAAYRDIIAGVVAGPGKDVELIIGYRVWAAELEREEARV